MLIVCDKEYNANGKLVLKEEQEPCPNEEEVLIKIKAFGINRPDILQKRGLYPPPANASKILGLECSGIAEKVGKNVTSIKEGDSVCALTAGGAYAEKVSVHHWHCFEAPTNLSFAEAASLPESFMTCWTNIFEHGMLERGESILIHGGNSGIGCAAIQLSLWAGAAVICSVRTEEKKRFCESLGCTSVINTQKEDFVKHIDKNFPKKMNVIIDMLGGDFTNKNLQCLREYGRLVQIAFLKGRFPRLDLMQIMKKKLVITGSTLRARSDEEKKRIADLLKKNIWPEIESGKIKPCLYKEYQLSQINEAHEFMENSMHMGKIAVNIP
tara:strand:+ start:3121 stop:4098 length:978 start_codon:yes stop_codon:yes gene_type:complete